MRLWDRMNCSQLKRYWSGRETEGYESRSQEVRRVKKRLAASANSASSSGAVRRRCWFCATNSCRIRWRTDLDPESHSCSSDVSRDTATSRCDDVMTSVHTTTRWHSLYSRSHSCSLLKHHITIWVVWLQTLPDSVGPHAKTHSHGPCAKSISHISSQHKQMHLYRDASDVKVKSTVRHMRIVGGVSSPLLRPWARSG